MRNVSRVGVGVQAVEREVTAVDKDVSGQRGGSIEADDEEAGIDLDAAGLVDGAVQRDIAPGAVLDDLSVARDVAREFVGDPRLGTDIELKCPGIHDVDPGNAGGVKRTAGDFQRAARRDRDGRRVGRQRGVAAQRQRAPTLHGKPPAGNSAAIGECSGPVEGEHATSVCDVSRAEGASASTAADLENAVRVGRSAGICVVRGQNQRPRSGVPHGPVAGDQTREGVASRQVEGEDGVQPGRDGRGGEGSGGAVADLEAGAIQHHLADSYGASESRGDGGGGGLGEAEGSGTGDGVREGG